MERFAIGIDVGGTKISAALVSNRGDIAVRLSEPTESQQGAAAVIEHMAEMVQNLLGEIQHVADGIGIGAAGMTDSRSGAVIHASNLGWRNVPLKQLLCERLPEKWQSNIWVDKDTNAAVLGEMFFGAGIGFKHLLYITVGTGVGGGMVLDGRLYHGASEGSSDFGHLVLQPEGERCGCGKTGCLETLASGPAIVRSFSSALSVNPQHVLYARKDELTAKDVVDAAKHGDTLAVQTLEQAGRWLGRAMAFYVDLNNPERIIVGGGVAAAAADLLLEPARRELEEKALPNNVKTVKVVKAGLGSESGVIGAAALVWQQHMPTQ